MEGSGVIWLPVGLKYQQPFARITDWSFKYANEWIEKKNIA